MGDLLNPGMPSEFGGERPNSDSFAVNVIVAIILIMVIVRIFT